MVSMSAAIKQGQEELFPLKDRIFGRTVCDDIYQPGDSTKMLAKAGDILNVLQAETIDDAGIESVVSVLLLLVNLSEVFAQSATV